MQTNDPAQLTDEKNASKKPYRKPTVQVYGTLMQLTGSRSAADTNRQDGGGGVNPGAPNNRT